MVGPVAEFVATIVGGEVAWLSPGRTPLAQSASESMSRLGWRHTANDAGGPGENWFCLLVIPATVPDRNGDSYGNLNNGLQDVGARANASPFCTSVTRRM